MSEGRHRLASRRAVAVFVAVQIAIPTVMLGVRWGAEGSRPQSEYPLSWQMYSSVDNGDYVASFTDGSQDALSTDDLPTIQRHVGYGDHVARMLCDLHPDVVSVERVNANSAFAGEVVTC